MAAKGFVNAMWVGSYQAELDNGTLLIPGETVVEIGKDEAEQSDNWQVVTSAKAPTPTTGADD